MPISRSQISKQIDGKLRGARDEKKKKRRVIASIKKQSYSKKPKVFKI
jgi:hypothetical protein|tara:strand:+ start:1254 stop:1397 length:144 start_codon:yes stop_codon:yes gene_type:complete